MSENTGSAKAQDENKQSRNRRRKSGGGRGDSQPSLNMAELRELAELVNEHGFTDFEFENSNIRIRLSKMTAAPIVHQSVQPMQSAAPTAAPPASAETQSPVAAAPVEAKEDLYKIPSPIVGTFYRSPSPDKEPYVSEGSKVTPETIVCIVEAMKLMNEIQAETSGEVVEIYVENGQPVEYGQPLFGIRK
jgi:acetyl-CoA carboxylase biotin carboxyl carrier protein